MMLSRVADSLYWMSRYLERAEHTARLIDVCLDLIPDRSNGAVSRGWSNVFAGLRLPFPQDTESSYDMVDMLVFDPKSKATLVSYIEIARENARQVRELISSEMWEQINQLYLQVKQSKLTVIWDDQPHTFFKMVKDGSHLFEGISASTMNHGEGWYFIQLGQYMERASNIAHLLRVHLDTIPGADESPSMEQYLDYVALLRSCTALEAYCKVYTAVPRYISISEFLLMNPEFPHSVRYSIERIRRSLHAISEAANVRMNRLLYRNIGKLTSMLTYDSIDDVVQSNFSAYLDGIQDQCNIIHTTLFDTFINYPIDEKLLPY